MEAARTGRVKHAGKFICAQLSNHGFQVRQGWKGVLPTRVKAAIRSDLVHLYGVAEEQIDVALEADDKSRAAGLARYGDDKSGRAPVMNDRIMIRAQPGQALNIGGAQIHMPDGAIMSIDTSTAGLHEAKGIILVENEEVFYRFERLNFPVPACWRSYTVVFRGKAHVARQDTCEDWLRGLDVPVIAFPDFDLAGLVFAAAVPRVSGLLWPGVARLEEMLKRAGRKDLFEAQSTYLDKASRLEEPFADAAGTLIKSGRGLNQEAFLNLAGRAA
ncbi:hypothetical protein ACGYLO_11535 [Sulfitobacter sp. 1A13353]|uniref:DUF7281 domain-containing protein n=1 Tax=Sulfitobacter sp. 1A13353 TaxID=3368568 RepID=UPI003745A299